MDKVNKAVFDANAQCCDIMNHLINEETMEETIKIDIPKGYEFAGVDKQKVIFEKIGCRYPKTYAECCEIIHSDPSFYIDTQLYSNKLESLYKLLICRDSYWKLAGEQMGLGKPWKPDFKDDSDKYFICYVKDEVWKSHIRDCNKVLVFPIAEMRDAFYEHFKDLIERCKELL